VELLLSESRVKEWPGRAILATISCGHRQRGAGPRGSRCSCIVRVSGRCLRCSRVQTQCRFSCRFQRSSVQFGALHWQHCTAIRTWVRVAAGGGGGWVCVCGPRLFSSLLAAGRWMDAQAASDLAPATARRWPTASPPASHWCRSCSVGGMQRTGSSLPAVVIAAKSRENCCCRVQTAFDGAPKRPISFTWISFKVPPSPDAHSLTARRPEHMHGGMW
jgi:hypothetical protein